MTISRKIIITEKAPAAIGPYAQANKAGDFIFASGQLPLDPATGELIKGTIEEQTERALENLSAVFEAAGTDLEHVIKTTVFLADLDDFVKMNKVYAHYFTGTKLPSRSTIKAGLPKGALIEIEAIAIAE